MVIDKRGKTMKRLIGILLMTLIVVPGCNIFGTSDNNSTTPRDEFILKFQNTGSYSIHALYITKDTNNWGNNVLAVDSLDSLDYVLIKHYKKQTTYAFKTMFDSAGTLVPLVFSQMIIGSIDTTTAYAGMGKYFFSNGYSWGLQITSGEHNITP